MVLLGVWTTIQRSLLATASNAVILHALSLLLHNRVGALAESYCVVTMILGGAWSKYAKPKAM